MTTTKSMSASRTSISHSQRTALRHYYQTTNPKPTHSALRAWFYTRFGHQISQSIVSRSLSDSFAYLDTNGPSVSEYRLRNCQWPWIEDALSEWLQEVEARSVKVPNDIIGAKAKQIWKKSESSQGLAMPKFSVGWVVKFRRRHSMRLQQLRDPNCVVVTFDHSSAENSPSQLDESSTITRRQTHVEFPFRSNAVTSFSTSSNSTNPKSRIVTSSSTLIFSSDHLIHLIQQNVFRALNSNKSLILSSGLIFEAPSGLMPIKQFNTKLCGGLTVMHALGDQHMPESLRPTPLQINCAHTGWINMFPFPKFRDNLIRKGVDFVPEEMCRDLFGDVFRDYITPLPDECGACSKGNTGTADFEAFDDYTAGRAGLINWGDPWLVESWEVTPDFIKRWGWSLEGCDDLIRATNRWRALRNEMLITEI